MLNNDVSKIQSVYNKPFSSPKLFNQKFSNPNTYFLTTNIKNLKYNSSGDINFGSGNIFRSLVKILKPKGTQAENIEKNLNLKPFITPGQPNGGPNPKFIARALKTLEDLEFYGIKISNPNPTPQGYLDSVTKQSLISEVNSKVSCGAISKDKGNILIKEINFSGKRPKGLDESHIIDKENSDDFWGDNAINVPEQDLDTSAIDISEKKIDISDHSARLIEHLTDLENIPGHSARLTEHLTDLGNIPDHLPDISDFFDNSGDLG